jgi:acyl-[acyl-carrier-protein] desaturase
MGVVSRQTEEALYRFYMEFFERAERKRRWSVFDDIPWDRWDPAWASTSRALCCETFCAVETYLPDYVAEGANMFRTSFGQSWFVANWAYEESKHGLALREYLLRSGQRSHEEMATFEQRIQSKRWTMPFDEPRTMLVYGALQERTTWMIYRKHLEAAEQAGDEVLATIYRHISKDEAAHASFYQRVLQVSLEEDREGTLRDIHRVMTAFRMPADDLVPGYEGRVELMRSVGIDRSTFLKEALFPILSRLGITLRDVARARANERKQIAVSSAG